MIDSLWINLKVLGKLPPFAKLNTYSELFYIETPKFYKPTSLWRMLRGDSRHLAIKRINGLIEKATFELAKQKNKNLINHLNLATHGLENMKKTYQDDITTIAAIERLLDKIKILVENNNDKDKDEDEEFQDA